MFIRRNLVIWIPILAIGTAVGGELVARFIFGLGDPPLFVSRPRLEYMYKPDQNTNRFGNHVTINRYGMRSKSFSPEKDAGETRIMIFGDSVVSGGSVTDQKDLATTILEKTLEDSLDAPVVVGNVSAGGWGPGNWLAYAEEFGFFDADIVVLILSSHDYLDNPTSGKLDENRFPTKRPVSALLEGLTRYLPRYVVSRETSNEDDVRSMEEISEDKEIEAQRGLDDLEAFLVLGMSVTDSVIVLQHWEKMEIERNYPKNGHGRIRERTIQIGLAPVSLDGYFRSSMDYGVNPFRDNIHPNATGQRLIASALYDAISPFVLAEK